MTLVWVNVWGKARVLRFATLAILSSTALGCIDDFDHPKGYGRNGGNGGSSGSNGYDCYDLCAANLGCDDSLSPSECRSQCADLERLVRISGCERVWDETLDCVSRAPNTCDASADFCAAELDDFGACYTDYCASYPEDCGF